MLFHRRKWELIAMNGLTRKPLLLELILVSCLLLVLTITVTGLQDKEVQFVTNAPIKASISNVLGSNASIGNASISSASAGSMYKPEKEFPDVPVDVNDKNLDSMRMLYSPFVVDFWEIGCRPCKSVDPTINEMALDFKGQIVFGKLCIDRNVASKKKYGISRTPTLLIFKEGTLVYRHVGNYPKQKLEEIILAALNTS
jgi:thiol-disulfide isomerase/thioredoxin